MSHVHHEYCFGFSLAEEPLQINNVECAPAFCIPVFHFLTVFLLFFVFLFCFTLLCLKNSCFWPVLGCLLQAEDVGKFFTHSFNFVWFLLMKITAESISKSDFGFLFFSLPIKVLIFIHIGMCKIFFYLNRKIYYVLFPVTNMLLLKTSFLSCFFHYLLVFKWNNNHACKLLYLWFFFFVEWKLLVLIFKKWCIY